MNRNTLKITVCLFFTGVMLIACNPNLGRLSPTWHWSWSLKNILKMKIERSGRKISSISAKSLERIRRKISPLGISIQNGLEKSELVNKELQKKKSRMPRQIYGQLFVRWQRNHDSMQKNKKQISSMSQISRTSVEIEGISSIEKRMMKETLELIANNDSLLSKIREY